MSVGDVLFYHSDDFGGKMIDWRTGGPYSHVCIEVENAQVIEAKWPKVNLDVRGTPDYVFTPQLDSTLLPDALIWLHSTVGDKYDVMNIVSCGIGILLPHKKVFTIPTMFICSELTCYFLMKAGYKFPANFQKDEDSIDLVSPNSLARLLNIL